MIAERRKRKKIGISIGRKKNKPLLLCVYFVDGMSDMSTLLYTSVHLSHMCSSVFQKRYEHWRYA